MFLTLTASYAAAASILYIPLDNRPVCLDDPLATMRAAGVEVSVPPTEILAGREQYGEPERLWTWLAEQAPTADALVISADSLLYGGLVSSRVHKLPSEVLDARLNKFRTLAKNNPNLRMYVFSTVMRTPKMSAGGIDPKYFEQYGREIFTYSALRDKSEQQQLTRDEQSELHRLFTAVPEEFMLDWLSRRQINYNLNAKLLSFANEGLFSYLLLGLDDNALYSRTRQELRNLLKTQPQLSAAPFAAFSGADQLGMLLLTRALNDIKGEMPFVAAVYAPGVGRDTIPSYQGDRIFNNIFGQVIAAGAYLTSSVERADLVLAVNTPENGITLEANNSLNTVAKRQATTEFAAAISTLSKSKPVAVADVAFGNGADNLFMAELVRLDLPQQLAAYSGWNTASNTIGFALSQGLLASNMSQSDKHKLISVRLLDDWAYQANVRQSVMSNVVIPRGVNPVQLGSHRLDVEVETTARLKQFAIEKFGGFTTPDFAAKHPWSRMFEVKIELYR